MCLPQECQGSGDLKAIATALEKMMSSFTRGEEKITLELDCSAAGGAEKGAGGVGKVTVNDDYATDAEPLPEKMSGVKSNGAPVATRSTYNSAAPFAFAPIVAAIMAIVIDM